MTTYSIGPATDRSGEVLSRLMPYRPPIEAILREVTGDPAALANAEARYSDGAVASQRWGQSVQQSSSKLAGSWSGRAATKCTWAIQDLAKQFDRIQRTLGIQAHAMARSAAALREARANVEKVLQAFDTTRSQFADRSRSVTPDVARMLAQQANSAGKALLAQAQKHKAALARVLTEVAASLKAAQSGHRRERDAARKAAEARCPFTHRFGGNLRNMIVGHEAKRYEVYLDGNNVPTIGIGINIKSNNPLGRDAFRHAIRTHPGGGFSASDVPSGKAFDDLITSELSKPVSARKRLTDEQIEAMYQYIVDDKIRAVESAGVKVDGLPPAVRAAVINTAFNSLTPIKAAAQDLKDGDFEAAAKKFEQFGIDAYNRILQKEGKKNGGLITRYAELATILRNQC
ncbi:MAG TPA: WXG100 family type VII secretion target [Candidatus Limnocylindrales bacterium]|nr:WXG100 family type VII secretion target [Candidatus Limnocylindrales bacterium]